MLPSAARCGPRKVPEWRRRHIHISFIEATVVRHDHIAVFECVRVCVGASVCACAFVRVFARARVRVCVCVRACVCACVCLRNAARWHVHGACTEGGQCPPEREGGG